MPQMPPYYYWYYVGVAPVSNPYWDGVVMFNMQLEGGERLAAPMLFTTREYAEAELRTLREGMPEAYLRAVDEYGESDVNEAMDNTPELGVFAMDPQLVSERLEDSPLAYAMVDDRLRLARDLSEELRR